MHKTLVTDWLTYIQNITQPFVGICLQCLCHNPALMAFESAPLAVFGQLEAQGLESHWVHS